MRAPTVKAFSGLLLCALALLSCPNIFDPDRDETEVCAGHQNSPFVLPYPVGETYVCLQGYVGGVNHHSEIFRYAVDFSMPIGSPVTAARSGVVDFIEETFEDGDFGVGKDNLVVLRHDDGTYSRYVHLTKNGVLVEIGQIIFQGDPIALSGNSGQSRAPHLHFDVTRGDGTRESQTIPVCFRNTKPHPRGLETGVPYASLPY
ncbi:MAG: M23 family metallopeptidase [Candidatus Aminicenantes bacterium]|nr:M23 family metallopeptidase [Candidatus Aminicenantes bacterium]